MYQKCVITFLIQKHLIGCIEVLCDVILCMELFCCSVFSVIETVMINAVSKRFASIQSIATNLPNDEKDHTLMVLYLIYKFGNFTAMLEMLVV